jgi:hypothetical protein
MAEGTSALSLLASNRQAENCGYSPTFKLAHQARGVRDNRHDPVLLWERPPVEELL